jgi:hypothetical protein
MAGSSRWTLIEWSSRYVLAVVHQKIEHKIANARGRAAVILEQTEIRPP